MLGCNWKNSDSGMNLCLLHSLFIPSYAGAADGVQECWREVACHEHH